MKRLEKAHIEYPDGIVVTKGNVLKCDMKILDCYPYYLDCGNDDLDEYSKIGDISCEQCWDKEYTP